MITAVNDEQELASHQQEERKESQSHGHCHLPENLSDNSFW
jgi:hypothetical protein